MRRFLCFFLFCFFAFPVMAQETTFDEHFISGFEDLPLMTGLIQLEDSAVSFDTPGGRIIEASAESPDADTVKIISFYESALPQLGWKIVSKNKNNSSLVLTRDGETLKISTEKGAPAFVRFELTTQQ